MKHYRHLTFNERKKIAELLAQGGGVRAISRILKRSPSTIAREIYRNCELTSQVIQESQQLLMEGEALGSQQTFYDPTRAHKNALKRKSSWSKRPVSK